MRARSHTASSYTRALGSLLYAGCSQLRWEDNSRSMDRKREGRGWQPCSCLFGLRGARRGEGLPVHAVEGALILADGQPAAAADEPSLQDPEGVMPLDALFVAAHNTAGTYLTVLEELLLAAGALDGQHGIAQRVFSFRGASLPSSQGPRS